MSKTHYSDKHARDQALLSEAYKAVHTKSVNEAAEGGVSKMDALKTFIKSDPTYLKALALEEEALQRMYAAKAEKSQEEAALYHEWIDAKDYSARVLDEFFDTMYNGYAEDAEGSLSDRQREINKERSERPVDEEGNLEYQITVVTLNDEGRVKGASSGNPYPTLDSIPQSVYDMLKHQRKLKLKGILARQQVEIKAMKPSGHVVDYDLKGTGPDSPSPVEDAEGFAAFVKSKRSAAALAASEDDGREGFMDEVLYDFRVYPKVKGKRPQTFQGTDEADARAQAEREGIDIKSIHKLEFTPGRH
jgi:hypothetical protein